MHDFAIYDFDSGDFSLATETDKRDLTKQDIELAVVKQLNSLPYMIKTRKVGDKFYYFLQAYARKCEKVLVFGVGQLGVYKQLDDSDLDNLQTNAYFDEKHRLITLITKFDKPHDYHEQTYEKDAKVEDIPLF